MQPETPRSGTAQPQAADPQAADRQTADAEPSQARTARAQTLRAEFTSEPFEGEGAPPAHAANALACLRAAGLEPEFGPLGTSVRGDRATVLPALADVMDTALSSGADRITLQVTADGHTTDEPATEDEQGTTHERTTGDDDR